MDKNILIAPNSFKECRNSIEIVNILSTYFPQNYSHSFPLSDGGDGFLAVCKNIFDLKPLTYYIPKIYEDDLFECTIGYNESEGIIFIESALILGLSLIPINKRYPLLINSKNLGILLKKIMEDFEDKREKLNKIVIGLGGTGTNDMGLGACSAFGLKIFDSAGNSLELIPKNFINASNIEWEQNSCSADIEFIVDVNNPLIGEKGASRTYAAQKGASQEEINILEDGFVNILKLLKDKGMIESSDNLSGAGGGIAAGMNIFFGAGIKSSRDFILNDMGLKNFKGKVKYVITGEGAFDKQSLMDKAPGIVINAFKDHAEKIFVICGTFDKNIRHILPKNAEIIELSHFFKSKEESIQNFEKGLWLASEKILKVINS
jgi:glycerate 2-kinase